MDIYLLQNVAMILITAVIVLLIFNKLKLPTMIGLFITGIVIGHVINDTSMISTLSELGVVFLLFIIGLEFSIEKFSAIKHYALFGGILQVSLTTILVTLLGLGLGLVLNSAIFLGFLVAFSSFEIFSSISLRTICRCFDASDRRNFSSYISSLRRHVFVRSEEKFFQKESKNVALQ